MNVANESNEIVEKFVERTNIQLHELNMDHETREMNLSESNDSEFKQQ